LPTFKDIEETDGITQTEMFAKVFAYSGTRIPDITGGFGTDISYKNLAIGGFFSYSLGTKIRLNNLYNDSGQRLPQPQQNMNQAFVNRWKHGYSGIDDRSAGYVRIGDRPENQDCR